MQITEITVNAGRTIPHPTHQFGNLRPEVTLKAKLSGGEDAAEATRKLQVMAEQLVEQHAAILTASIQEREVLRNEHAHVERLTRSIEDQQQQLHGIEERRNQRVSSLPGQRNLFEQS